MTRPKRFLVVSDNHGDMQDDATVDAVLQFKKDFNPDILVHLGDNWDFRNLRKGATPDEKRDSMKFDWTKGNQFLRSFFAGRGEKHFLFGNHDDRLWQYSRSAKGVLRDYATDAIIDVTRLLRSLGVKTYPYDSALGICKLGKLSCIHGYHAGIGACRQHAAVYGNCIFGHVHTIESAPVASLDPAEARSIGCLCIRDMDYINAKTGKLRWAQGWAYGFLFPDGSYQLYQARKLNGRFYAATNIKTY